MNLPFLSDEWFDVKVVYAAQESINMFEFLGSLFVVGSMMFYGLCTLAFFLLCWACEEDEVGMATFCVVAWAVIAFICGDIHTAILACSFAGIAKVIAVYIVGSVVYSFAKFGWEIKSAQLNGREVPDVDYLKRRVPMWMAYWPASLIATVFGDVVRHGFKYLARTFGGIYDKIYAGMTGQK